MSSAQFQIEDQTDEDFFDKLVEDDYDASQSKPTGEMTRDFPNLSIDDALDDPGEPEIANEVESSGKDNVLKTEEEVVNAPKEENLVLDGSVQLESVNSENSEKVGVQGLTSVKSDALKGTAVKEVQWSAFSIGSSQEFEAATGLDPYSDFLTENTDGFVGKPVEFSSNVGSVEQSDSQYFKSSSEQIANENDPQYWENLYPGWKYDVSTGQWYQEDSYELTADGQLDSSNVASVDSASETSGVSYLQQASQPVLETIAEESTVSSANNWNEVSEGSIQYPSNMMFDPQYPEWYYDTNIQQWCTLESYTEGLANSSNVVQEQLPQDSAASAGLSSAQNHSLYSNVGQSEQHGDQGKNSQDFGQDWDASMGINAQQTNMYSNITQPAQHASQSQSQSSQDLGHNWDVSMSNYDQNYLYNNTSQSDQTISKGWGRQESGQNRYASTSNLAEQNRLYSNTSTTVHQYTRSQDSKDFGQNWDASLSNYNQQNSLYSNISHSEQHTSQGQDSQSFGGKWDASNSISAQQSMWKPQPIGANSQNAGFFGNQHTGNPYGLLAGSQMAQTTKGTSFKAFEPVASQFHATKNSTPGFQSFTPKESVHQFSPPHVEQTLQAHLSNNHHGDQNLVNSPKQSFQIANLSYSQFSYTPSDGRSSAGRPPHALVAFGFGGKLIVMKHLNSLGAHLDYGSQESGSGAISVLNLSEVVIEKGGASGMTSSSSHDYFHALCQPSFPGPLVGGNAATKDVNKWIDEKIGKCEPASTDYRKEEFLKLLFSLLKIMCQHYGKLRSPFGADPSLEEADGPESAVTKLFASVRKNGAHLSEFGSLTHCMHTLPSEGQLRATAIQVQNLLISGRRKEALQYAQEGQLWGPALVLAGQLGQQFYVDTVKKMAQRQFISGSPLRTLCLLIAGQHADAISGEVPVDNSSGASNGPFHLTQVPAHGMLDDWEENLAIITANRTDNDGLVILHLGDCLLKQRREIIAAHACYLVAEANFESYSDSARLCLIGADHWKCPRTYASPEAIQRTEVYEYSKVLGNSQFVLLPLQPYKLIYAHMLAEVGKVSESLRYCQASLKLLKNCTRAPEVELWKFLLSSLEERLKTHQQGGYSSNLAPGKLVGKLFTSIDRSIHRMIGAPPSPTPLSSPLPLPPMPQMSPNSKDNFSMSSKVVNSQSTMAMSTLVPSASVEAISQWAGDDNRKSMHNRSISEPDFGRSPKQDESPIDDQNKSSRAPSKFGRIGSQLLQKTMGWVSRSRSDRQAKLGESNKFYYDEKLKRWVEEGVEPPSEEAALPPPPPTGAAFQNVTSDYNINNALKNQNPAAIGGPEKPAFGFPPISSDSNSGVPPIPPSQNQFSARARTGGVRSRYVDTFNKGGAGGNVGALANSFQSPAIPSVKPAIGAKFFMPTAPAPSDEHKSDVMGGTIEESISDEPSTSEAKQSTFSSPMHLQRFPSMDNITPTGNKVASSIKGDSTFSHVRAASWSGTDGTNHKFVGLVGSSPPLFFPQNPPSTRSNSSQSLQANGGPTGDELDEVEL